jgi:hypothetical protein
MYQTRSSCPNYFILRVGAILPRTVPFSLPGPPAEETAPPAGHKPPAPAPSMLAEDVLRLCGGKAPGGSVPPQQTPRQEVRSADLLLSLQRVKLEGLGLLQR